ncbi:hypothetical protein P175DRAFT_0432568 [Aspergillus ochraceoroseus IBT 24754]|uniref:ADP-ribosylation factor n=3 Tax=Aspergillus subgen. Nidulantes TaxID=2720870 RepID=A0A0F8VSZ5_9EURO|nr:uncharacterized protein P175DRAFT_0432568 [Aspergillus ochraceoroseus IBT 24754]KKK24604.1 hypothetical protein AOCH_003203 [Aspergillus ochraceoroseus]KKK26356.1 hypothetical protein ARAM_004198 [Aspergillus rambellii]PTU22656.1 hypothetical protein P175DRAFT_0432568 [Aspergillus ochraceoroseus IBT 24754]
MVEVPQVRSLMTPQEYYSSFPNNSNIPEKFKDIDEEPNFRNCLKLLRDTQTGNFVLDFGNEDAWCAVNLEREDLTTLLSHNKPKCIGTRWINIWAPEEQKDLIKAITTYYGVSERLQGMMCTDPVTRTLPPKQTQPPRKSFQSKNSSRQTRSYIDGDIEEGHMVKNLASLEEIQTVASFRGLTFGHVVDQIWHFCSVDYGPRYTCIGYNSLYVVPNLDMSNGTGLPDGRRLWSWLILFDDGTVVSIQENPYPGQSAPSEGVLKSVNAVARRNIHLIFAAVSKQHSASSESDSLVTTRVRPFHDAGSDPANIKQDDGPSLLFFYIFDDWVSSYALVARREHKYGVVLDNLRVNMLNKPVVDLIDELHWLGRQLAVLRRLYQSYELIMTRILQRQRVLRDEARSNHPKVPFGQPFSETEMLDRRQMTVQSGTSVATTLDTSVGVQLSAAAVARFERLLDRIKLYCLSEIESCLTEKESLTFLNFNLIALKDSQAVEKLTRITILLAKITIVFLPVSLMTAYFSTELAGVKGVYTEAQYWVSFAVIMFVSILLLALFGYVSDTMEGKTIYRSMFRTFFRNSKSQLFSRRGEAVANSTALSEK